MLLFQIETEEKQDNTLSFNEYTIEPVRLQKEDKPNTKAATSPIAPTNINRQSKPEKTNDKKKGLLSVFKYYSETNQFNGYAEVDTPTSEVCWVCTEVLKREDVIIRSGCGCNAWVHGRCLTRQYDACNNERNELLFHGKIGNESEFLKQCGLCREFLIGSEQSEVRYANTINALHIFDKLKEIERRVCWMEWLPKIIRSFLERIMSINIHWRSQGRKLKPFYFLFVSFSIRFVFYPFRFSFLSFPFRFLFV